MNIPKHIAIIPDGNRRWAKDHHLPSFAGHKKAFEEVLPSLLEKAGDMGVEYFTFWALSSENLVKREKSEIESLFALGKAFYGKKLQELKEKGVRVNFIGNIAELPEDIQQIIHTTMEETKDNTHTTFTIAINYGGRNELLRAVQKIVNSNVSPNDINQDTFFQFLDTHNIPDPDLVIRTGGENRMSGFMPWQTVYSELYFTDLFFPDFSPAELEKAVADFSNRKRNFGK